MTNCAMSGRCFWKTSDTRWKIRSETELARRKLFVSRSLDRAAKKNEKDTVFLKKSVDNVADSCYTINCSVRNLQLKECGKDLHNLTRGGRDNWGIAQLGALDWQSRGQRFDPAYLHHWEARFDESQSELFPLLSIRQIDMSQTASFAFSPKQAFQEKRPFLCSNIRRLTMKLCYNP